MFPITQTLSLCLVVHGCPLAAEERERGGGGREGVREKRERGRGGGGREKERRHYRYVT